MNARHDHEPARRRGPGSPSPYSGAAVEPDLLPYEASRAVSAQADALAHLHTRACRDPSARFLPLTGTKDERYPLSLRTANALERAGLTTYADLAWTGPAELARTRGLGKNALEEIEVFLKLRRRNLPLKQDPRKLRPATAAWLRSAGYISLGDLCTNHGAVDLETFLTEGPKRLIRQRGSDPYQQTRASADVRAELAVILLRKRALPSAARPSQALLFLLHHSSAARGALGAFDASRLGGPVTADHDQLAALSSLIEDRTKAGSLHPEALLDWRPLRLLSRSLYPEPSTLLDLLDALYRANGSLPPLDAVTTRKINDSIITGSLSRDLETLSSALHNHSPARQIILRGRYAPTGRTTFRALADTLGVSHERTRQISLQMAQKLRESFETRPLPYFRSALLFAGHLLPPPPKTHAATHDFTRSRDLAGVLKYRGIIPAATPREHERFLTYNLLTYHAAITHYALRFH